ncbi:MAG: tRNA (N(6)-L-threonylcarbamoyladenosine(37)-C(2))-methylthiotransferase MtaB [Candidatus Omnitrophota bacterium]
MKTFKITTLGCKVNQYESQAMREQLIAAGFVENRPNRPADLYLINSCAVTQHAQNRSFEHIRRAKKENPRCRVVFTGCCVNAALPKPEKSGSANFLVDNQGKHRLTHWLGIKGESAPLKISSFKGHSRAFVKIQDGCDNFCSYCVIPFLRGAARSRDKSEIIAEVKRLVENGFKEIVLTGICLGDFGKDEKSGGRRRHLVDLLADLENIPGAFRLRLSSIEAQDVTGQLISKLAESPRLCPHLHIPFQSGDDEILKRMQRGYCARDYLNIVAKVRRLLPDIAISTDIMVGFPSEEERHFQNTRRFLSEVKPMRVHVFPFSPRPQTAAGKMPQRVAQSIIKQREAILLEQAKALAWAYHCKFIGKTLEVLVEASEDKKGGWLKGYSENYIPVRFSGREDFKGNLVKVKLTGCNREIIMGSIDF